MTGSPPSPCTFSPSLQAWAEAEGDSRSSRRGPPSLLTPPPYSSSPVTPPPAPRPAPSNALVVSAVWHEDVVSGPWWRDHCTISPMPSHPTPLPPEGAALVAIGKVPIGPGGAQGGGRPPHLRCFCCPLEAKPLEEGQPRLPHPLTARCPGASPPQG